MRQSQFQSRMAPGGAPEAASSGHHPQFQSRMAPGGAFQSVKTQATAQLSRARRDVPALWSEVAVGCAHAVRAVSAESDALLGSALERARHDALRARQTSADTLEHISMSAKGLVRKAATDCQALMREIAGQGPEKTLQRGFAIVRNPSGTPVAKASQAADSETLEIEFQDGRVTVTTQKQL